MSVNHIMRSNLPLDSAPTPHTDRYGFLIISLFLDFPLENFQVVLSALPVNLTESNHGFSTEKLRRAAF